LCTPRVWNERHELLDEIHGMGTRLLEVASGEAARVSPQEPAEEAEQAAAASAAAAETGPTGTSAREEAPAEMSMATAREGTEQERE
jgi:hypothetical protein